MIRFSLKKSSWCSGTPIYRKWNAYNFPPPPFILVPAWAWMRSSEYSTRPSIWFSHSSPWSFGPLLSPRRSLRKTRDCIIFFFTNLARSMCTLFVGVCSVPLMYKWYRECPWWCETRRTLNDYPMNSRDRLLRDREQIWMRPVCFSLFRSRIRKWRWTIVEYNPCQQHYRVLRGGCLNARQDDLRLSLTSVNSFAALWTLELPVL